MSGIDDDQVRDLTIVRVYDAPARLLFRAWSERDLLMRWFGPEGWPVTLCEVDFRVGGTFRMAMTGHSGVQNPPFGGSYLEIVPGRRIVYDNGFEMAGAEKMVTTITFDEVDGRTTVTVHTVFGSRRMYVEHVGAGFEAGTNSGLDQLGDLAVELLSEERS
ncbi:uncharacterized protein YndB with AHSA1/START domain [Caulobacter ginsengisoli]|uniref:Uncharacterized protein YndB with AHSA1/START domain n=1 Tax=Caulobacter ginsengisoli TaxID=400775 RepID=A0ABU0IKK4_9CAUL|nr:SRPBCC domain-containing protein [Caulobacter ginsengisoli]MDQ0462543.1 uncharacterized protein YndB with AHSA1/START domain [Caulobacter ginsengisoli]